mmetsp:Transcript_26570/g.57955  ORF Transcript_26570/g.57955 Transcript_26570/m.57955 type:complete len:275 (-) Transcript_26570:828-1652(-)|eukprot:CAMPEP_0202916922 /NCGR_PEP_ID=MMETSP1392-20130828/69780_1 /ASSEMBLY_ACC=CAM_ASM_000868 /TAXON_ID=225041 /ORGANISM="Chlamydomonas chlamydogama, Strain SAG 11-48b" /LENGTH=274 /DNA_ID=CAMNT_0049609503 /DNA_START=209 /DNA_END=1033 /DNA_ORIENTATION=+
MAAVNLKILTWNINDGEISCSAPPSWTTDINREKITQEILKHQADILCIQELDRPLEGLLELYTAHGHASSHKGFVQLYTCNKANIMVSELMPVGPCLVSRMQVPVSFATSTEESAAGQTSIDQPPSGQFAELYVIGTHLAPFRGNDQARQQQLVKSMRNVDEDVPVVILGDMNMRSDEGPPPGGFQDIAIPSPASSGQGSAAPVPQNTWAPQVNKYFEGNDAPAIRFDRIFVRGCSGSDLQLMGDTPASEAPGHFLSDHYGLTATLSVPLASI